MTSAIPLLTLSTALALLCAASLYLVVANQRLLRAERRRAADRAELDRTLLAKETARAEGEALRADTAMALVEEQRARIRLLKETLEEVHGAVRIQQDIDALMAVVGDGQTGTKH